MSVDNPDECGGQDMWWVFVPWLLFVACLVATLLACRAGLRRQQQPNLPTADDVPSPVTPERRSS